MERERERGKSSSDPHPHSARTHSYIARITCINREKRTLQRQKE